MTRTTLSFVALIASLVCFVVALLMTSNVVVGGDFHPWGYGGFIGLVFALLVEKTP